MKRGKAGELENALPEQGFLNSTRLTLEGIGIHAQVFSRCINRPDYLFIPSYIDVCTYLFCFVLVS